MFKFFKRLSEPEPKKDIRLFPLGDNFVTGEKITPQKAQFFSIDASIVPLVGNQFTLYAFSFFLQSEILIEQINLSSRRERNGVRVTLNNRIDFRMSGISQTLPIVGLLPTTNVRNNSVRYSMSQYESEINPNLLIRTGGDNIVAVDIISEFPSTTILDDVAIMNCVMKYRYL